MTRWIRSQYLRKSRKLPHNPNSDKKAECICSQRCAPLFNLLIQTSTSSFPGSSAFRRALPSPSLSSDSAKRQGEGQAQPEVCAAQGPLKQCRHLERVLCALTCPLHCFPSGSVPADSTPLRRTVPIPLTPPAPRASPSLFFHIPDVSYTARSPRAVPARTSSYASPHEGCTARLPPRPDHRRR